MCDEWMPHLELRLSVEEFRQLPRNAGFSYSYVHDIAWINPRPRFYHAILDLTDLQLEGVAEVAVRPFRPGDWDALTDLFVEAFVRHQPFAGLPASQRREVAQQCLDKTRTGGDGPFIADASFVAVEPTGRLLGAVLITLLPLGDPEDWDSYTWNEPPPPDCIERCDGTPHLTWIFVDPERCGHGVGTRLLQVAAERLLAMGFNDLLSTFLLGNETSMLWHWRTGFRLLSYPGSPRRVTRDD